MPYGGLWFARDTIAWTNKKTEIFLTGFGFPDV